MSVPVPVIVVVDAYDHVHPTDNTIAGVYRMVRDADGELDYVLRDHPNVTCACDPWTSEAYPENHAMFTLLDARTTCEAFV